MHPQKLEHPCLKKLFITKAWYKGGKCMRIHSCCSSLFLFPTWIDSLYCIAPSVLSMKLYIKKSKKLAEHQDFCCWPRGRVLKPEVLGQRPGKRYIMKLLSDTIRQAILGYCTDTTPNDGNQGMNPNPISIKEENDINSKTGWCSGWSAGWGPKRLGTQIPTHPWKLTDNSL